MKKTQIFKSYEDFQKRKDKKTNGVSIEFVDGSKSYFEIYGKIYDFEKDNITNEGCWNCFLCAYCTDSENCVRCHFCNEALFFDRINSFRVKKSKDKPISNKTNKIMKKFKAIIQLIAFQAMAGLDFYIAWLLMERVYPSANNSFTDLAFFVFVFFTLLTIEVLSIEKYKDGRKRK